MEQRRNLKTYKYRDLLTYMQAVQADQEGWGTTLFLPRITGKRAKCQARVSLPIMIITITAIILSRKRNQCIYRLLLAPSSSPLTLTTSWQLIWRSGHGWCHDSRHLCPSKPAIWGAQSPSIVQNVPSGTVSLQQDWLWNWLHPVTVFIAASKSQQSVQELRHHAQKWRVNQDHRINGNFKVMICNDWYIQQQKHKGSFQKRFSGFCPLRGEGGYPPPVR